MIVAVVVAFIVAGLRGELKLDEGWVELIDARRRSCHVGGGCGGGGCGGGSTVVVVVVVVVLAGLLRACSNSFEVYVDIRR